MLVFGLTLFAPLGCAAIIVGIYFAVRYYKKCRYKKIAEEILRESKRLAALQDINKHFAFHDVNNVVLSPKLNSKAQFDNFDDYKYALSEVRRDLDSYREMISKLEDNQVFEGEYFQQLIEIVPSDYDDAEWIAIEQDLFEKMRLKPKNGKLVVVFSYTSPAGRKHYQDDAVYGLSQIKVMLEEAKRINAEGKARNAVIQRERSLMSNDLRYDVLRRDGFRCVLCGSSANDGVKLEVDHIFPVSKGGKTELSNLRTLCDRCNRGKRDKVE